MAALRSRTPAVMVISALPEAAAALPTPVVRQVGPAVAITGKCIPSMARTAARSDGGHCPANTRCGSCDDGSGLICCYGPGEFSSVGFGDTTIATYTTPAAGTTYTPPPAQTTPHPPSSAAAGAGGGAATNTETTTETAFVTSSSSYYPASTSWVYYTTTYTYYFSSYFFTQRPSSASLITQQVTHTTTFTVSATGSYEADVSFYSVAMSVKSDVDYSASRQSLTLTSPTAAATATTGGGSAAGATSSATTLSCRVGWLPVLCVSVLAMMDGL
ncbi:hypothetical protein B0A48_07302 [Cryoendolithus antarcticus]|uniref:Uncharacterized protein n=1 Tax=Cryoendolithus antarcticus TaxID=1507870 RepID=A0A1V8T883_9PEZI|nr:hypothetical protein B0A48_07302 [Cryoendolithus antarcticus]